MTDQLQVAKEWLADLSKIVSRQKTKEDYEYAKKRTDSLEWLINRVEELEKEIENLVFDLKNTKHFNKLHKKRATELEISRSEIANSFGEAFKENRRYKQALEEIKKEETVTTGLSNGQVAYTMSGHIARKALEGEE